MKIYTRPAVIVSTNLRMMSTFLYSTYFFFRSLALQDRYPIKTAFFCSTRTVLKTQYDELPDRPNFFSPVPTFLHMYIRLHLSQLDFTSKPGSQFLAVHFARCAVLWRNEFFLLQRHVRMYSPNRSIFLYGIRN